ncbi:acyl carrier protein [Streptomyces sp. NPDC004267]|uniref:acyl carrier protein n=1 Tax=Streptomyces sp. NPDC004267 TaxID=3364694 RepID=UPI0036745136
MTADTPVEASSARWSPALASVRADALDCLQANLAVLADDAHGAGAHLALGAPTGFATTRTPSGLPTPAAGPERRLAEAEELLGLRTTARWDGVDGPRLRELLRDNAVLYVIGDAYTMPWVPYAGHDHMEHSFLLTADNHGDAGDAGDGTVLVIDAYHNDTPWGSARPGVWRLPAADLDAVLATKGTALALEATAPPQLDAAAVLTANAAAMSAAGPRIDAYVTAMREAVGDPDALDALVLDVWVLGRARTLHAAWLGTVPGVSADAAEARAQAWRRYAAHTYVAARRARRGGAVPASVIDQLDRLLRDDVETARRPAVPQAPSDPRAVVVEELTAVLGADVAGLPSGAPLRDLPQFNSFRLVDVIERVESRLGTTIDPEALREDSFDTVDTLCRLFSATPAVEEAS